MVKYCTLSSLPSHVISVIAFLFWPRMSSRLLLIFRICLPVCLALPVCFITPVLWCCSSTYEEFLNLLMDFTHSALGASLQFSRVLQGSPSVFICYLLDKHNVNPFQACLRCFLPLAPCLWTSNEWGTSDCWHRRENPVLEHFHCSQVRSSSVPWQKAYCGIFIHNQHMRKFQITKQCCSSIQSKQLLSLPLSGQVYEEKQGRKTMTSEELLTKHPTNLHNIQHIHNTIKVMFVRNLHESRELISDHKCGVNLNLYLFYKIIIKCKGILCI